MGIMAYRAVMRAALVSYSAVLIADVLLVTELAGSAEPMEPPGPVKREQLQRLSASDASTKGIQELTSPAGIYWKQVTAAILAKWIPAAEKWKLSKTGTASSDAVIEITLNKDGKVRDVIVSSESVNKECRDAALLAVKEAVLPVPVPEVAEQMTGPANPHKLSFQLK